MAHVPKIDSIVSITCFSGKKFDFEKHPQYIGGVYNKIDFFLDFKLENNFENLRFRSFCRKEERLIFCRVQIAFSI